MEDRNIMSPTAVTADTPARADTTQAVESFAAVAADISCLKRELGRLLQGMGCPSAVQLGAMAVLAHLEHGGPSRPSHVAQHLRVDLSVVSRHIKALEDHGFVRRTTDAGDRRAHLVSVTPQGQHAAQLLREAAAEQLADVLAAWDDIDVVALRHLLDRLHHDLTHRPTGPHAVIQFQQP